MWHVKAQEFWRVWGLGLSGLCHSVAQQRVLAPMGLARGLHVVPLYSVCCDALPRLLPIIPAYHMPHCNPSFSLYLMHIHISSWHTTELFPNNVFHLIVPGVRAAQATTVSASGPSAGHQCGGHGPARPLAVTPPSAAAAPPLGLKHPSVCSLGFSTRLHTAPMLSPLQLCAGLC